MRVIVLGSGGAIPIPRPLCKCKTCTEARNRGIPFKRTGPSLYIENESILIDTPEEIMQQLEREKISDIKHVFYTHWHPDHVMGLRLFEHLPKEKRGVKVYIPEKDYENFEKNYPQLDFFRKNKFIKIITYSDRTPITIKSLTITPLEFKRKDRIRFGFLIDDKKKKMLYAPCSNYQMKIDKHYKKIDLAFLECGWVGPTKTTRRKARKNSDYQDHISLEETISLAKQIKAKHTILTHVDGSQHKEKISHIDLCERGNKEGFKVAYDGMKVET